ncbi:interferon gamma 1-like [Centroberyx affinis]|uniref:interferon gamma 1-like n=1 Tax=Centroberyx affinis TaxID=166261 RepID=UPI003A5C5DFB
MCLLVLLGVLVLSCGPVQSRYCRFVSENLKQTHESIAEPLELKQPVVSSRPLFSPLIQSINGSCQRREQVLVINATLDVYLRIFSSVLQQNQNQNQIPGQNPVLLDQLPAESRSQVLSALVDLQQKMMKLKKHLNLEREDTLKSVLSTLDKMDVDDLIVQKKALAEFTLVYQAASVIGSKHC